MTRAARNVCLTALIAVSISACAGTTTQLGKVSPEVVRAEQLKQQQLVIQSGVSEQQRLSDIAYPMMKSAVPLCGRWITTRSGLMVSNLHSFSREYQEAARALGFSDTLAVTGIIAGSAADRAGLKAGDRFVGMSGRPAPSGRRALEDFLTGITPRPARRGEPALAQEPLQFVVRRTTDGMVDQSEIALAVAPDTVCAYGSVAAKDESLNAWADGQQVVVTTAMMRFAGTDDELAVVVAHEIAHNAMRHLDARKKNATLGALLGAIVDVAAASQGVNTGGDFTNQGAAIGAMTYSQDFEREADYVGLYILARSGRPFASAPNFWRRMAQESPGSIKYASSHPTSAERFVRMEQTVAEIQRKQSENLPLVPDPKQPARAP